MTYACRSRPSGTNRREFLKIGATSVSALAYCTQAQAADAGTPLELEKLVKVTQSDEPAPIDGATWYMAEETGAGLAFRLAPGALADARYLTADVLSDGTETVVFAITLHEQGSGGQFFFRFALLNQCSARIRLPLDMIDLNRWGIDREGAFLKPRCYGKRIRLDRVDRVWFKVIRKGDGTARWCLTPLTATPGQVEPLTRPVLPKGPLLDELGQSRIRDWPGKTKSEDEVVARLRRQRDGADAHRLPEGLSAWGGWKTKRIGPGEGFFRTHHDGRRWWLVDPEGPHHVPAGVGEPGRGVGGRFALLAVGHQVAEVGPIGEEGQSPPQPPDDAPRAGIVQRGHAPRRVGDAHVVVEHALQLGGEIGGRELRTKARSAELSVRGVIWTGGNGGNREILSVHSVPSCPNRAHFRCGHTGLAPKSSGDGLAR